MRVRAGVESVRRQQLLVCAAFGDAPGMQHDNLIGVLKDRRAVRDDDRRRMLAIRGAFEPANRSHELGLGGLIAVIGGIMFVLVCLKVMVPRRRA